MKVYFSVNDLYKQFNPYTWTLADGLKAIDSSVEIIWGHGYFWSDGIYSCDIVHIHWPEQLLMSHGLHTAVELKDRLCELKQRGVKIVATCHNLEPHTNRSVDRVESYDVVYGMADLIFHLGEYSHSLLEKKYPHVKHVEILHHVYDTVYTNIPSYSEAIKHLHLNPQYRYVLCFGQFRNDEERKLVLGVYGELKNDGYRILAPGFSPVAHRRKNIWLLFKTRLSYLKYSLLYPGIIKSFDVVSDKDVPFYYAASDVCFIQRKDILNSGNVPLAFYMGNIVIGPDMGNVGPLLRMTKNPVFNPNDFCSVMDAVREALRMSNEKGLDNRKWAESNLLTETVCRRILESYRDILLCK
ncbi:MAG: hypothetical protein NC206_07520 [Bacteroides sp.]|nr:hypothetical protein [Roseburia sp.]MCM1346920.1 hypothetical protein [Bacteroides sp.]MCM1421451.1 hypothetical protein [Bacteroides sp.]